MKFKVELTALGKIQHARAVEDLDIEEARYYTRGLFTDLYLQYVGVQRGMGSYPAAVIQVTCGGKFSTTLTFTRPVSSSRYLSWELEAQFVELITEMRAQRQAADVHRSHGNPRVCAACGFRDACEERLA